MSAVNVVRLVVAVALVLTILLAVVLDRAWIIGLFPLALVVALLLDVDLRALVPVLHKSGERGP